VFVARRGEPRLRQNARALPLPARQRHAHRAGTTAEYKRLVRLVARAFYDGQVPPPVSNSRSDKARAPRASALRCAVAPPPSFALHALNGACVFLRVRACVPVCARCDTRTRSSR
jgi:hypothetical protein